MDQREKDFLPESKFSAEEKERASELEKKWNEILSSSKSVEYFNRFGRFGIKLQKNHPGEFNNYLLYHILGGSNREPRDKASKFDFEGEDSIEQFILKCYEEIFPVRENDRAKQ